MKAWIKTTPRKDGKHKVTLGFDNGRRFNKLYTPEQIKEMVDNKNDYDEIYYTR